MDLEHCIIVPHKGDTCHNTSYSRKKSVTILKMIKADFIMFCV